TPDGPTKLGALDVESGAPEHWSFDATGGQVGVATKSGTFERLDTRSGAVLGTLTWQLVQNGFFHIVPSHDFRVFASVSTDGTAAIRDMPCFQSIQALPAFTGPRAFSPEGTLLVLDARAACPVLPQDNAAPPFTSPPGANLRSRVIDVQTGDVDLD